MVEQQARMRALIDQALAEAKRRANGSETPIAEVHLDLYTGASEDDTRTLFADAARGTAAETARLVLKQCGSRYICWNCCGLRFDGYEGVCPNCGEEALEVPEEIAFALRRVVMQE
jgi:Zn finger protein HypA/HybF involved in hydrogenase expression